jgi:hypothetical protein
VPETFGRRFCFQRRCLFSGKLDYRHRKSPTVLVIGLILRHLRGFVVVVPRFTAGWVVLVEGRKWAVYPIPPYEGQARSGETVKDVRRRSHHASGAQRA